MSTEKNSRILDVNDDSIVQIIRNSEDDDLRHKIKVLITTEQYTVKGHVILPLPNVLENPTDENLLFYMLNHYKFICINNCYVTNNEKLEFNPGVVKCYILNLAMVQSCQIINEDD